MLYFQHKLHENTLLGVWVRRTPTDLLFVDIYCFQIRETYRNQLYERNIFVI
jgi:hypothetical protein